jgi:peptidoglycan/LPS O-acetylase OafA/YrhL
MLASLVLTPVRPRLELWYLWSLAVALVLAQRTARVPVRVQLAAGGVVAAYSLSSLAPTDNPAWLGLPSFYVFFLLGYHYPDAPLALVERTRRSPGLAWLIVAAAAAGCLAAFVLGVGHWMGPGLLIHALGALAALAAAGPLAGSRLLQYLGARTMPIYLAHTPLITVIVWALQPYREHDVVAALAPVLPVLLCAVTVPLTLALHAVLQRTPARVFYAPPAWLVPLAARLTGEPRRGEVSGLATAGLTSS